VLVSFAFGPLAYLSKLTSCCTLYIAHPLGLGSGGPSQAFAWILALSTVAGLLAWMTLCICYLRFYAACKVQGLDRNTLPFKSRLQPYAGWVGAIGSLSTFTLIDTKGLLLTNSHHIALELFGLPQRPVVDGRFYRRLRWDPHIRRPICSLEARQANKSESRGPGVSC